MTESTATRRTRKQVESVNWFSLVPPHAVAIREAIGPNYVHTTLYAKARSCGLYKKDTTTNADGHDALSWEARKIAVEFASSVVALVCKGSGSRPFYSSGIVVDVSGTKKIITSAYVLGERSGNEAYTEVIFSFLMERR